MTVLRQWHMPVARFDVHVLPAGVETFAKATTGIEEPIDDVLQLRVF